MNGVLISNRPRPRTRPRPRFLKGGVAEDALRGLPENRLQKSSSGTGSRTRTILGRLRQTMIRAASIRILAQLFNFTLFAVASPAQDAQNPPTAAPSGKQIYLYGTGYNGVPIEALAGEGSVKVPAAGPRSVNCHGPGGRGKPAVGIYQSNLRWTELSKPYAITTGSGRERPPYNESLVIRAITMGIDSGGNRLNTAMPKYLLTREQADDLVPYLKTLEHVLDPGIADQSIKTVLILPPE